MLLSIECLAFICLISLFWIVNFYLKKYQNIYDFIEMAVMTIISQLDTVFLKNIKYNLLIGPLDLFNTSPGIHNIWVEYDEDIFLALTFILWLFDMIVTFQHETILSLTVCLSCWSLNCFFFTRSWWLTAYHPPPVLTFLTQFYAALCIKTDWDQVFSSLFLWARKVCVIGKTPAGFILNYTNLISRMSLQRRRETQIMICLSKTTLAYSQSLFIGVAQLRQMIRLDSIQNINRKHL